MRKPTRLSLAMLISAGALSVVVSAPAAFAEEGHGGRDGGRGSDDVVTVVTPVNAVDNDVNDDHGVDAVVTTMAGAPTVVEDRNDAPDDND
jgi:hypothetical protein